MERNLSTATDEAKEGLKALKTKQMQSMFEDEAAK